MLVKHNFQSYCTDIPLITTQGESVKKQAISPRLALQLIRIKPVACFYAQYQVFQEDLLEDDQEHALNCICFYDNLDNGQFNNHEEDWVLVYEQKVVEYGKEYTKEQLLDLDRKMPGAIYLPVNPLLREKIVNPKIPASRTVYSQRSGDGNKYMV
ncbi:hypothetical protein Glove_457g52 [Diversispora epigaea]|uniref:Uncharacterized protein n=1 Tax=Diversispora epigaea TaxID=1348612 RepID=A0A397GP29_9GLOM|nr:hypothetical protein Glove_457g52 [Diversispora epigaea]